MKKHLRNLFASTLLLSLFGCSRPELKQAPVSAPKIAVTSSTPTPVPTPVFDEQAYRNYQRRFFEEGNSTSASSQTAVVTKPATPRKLRRRAPRRALAQEVTAPAPALAAPAPRLTASGIISKYVSLIRGSDDLAELYKIQSALTQDVSYFEDSATNAYASGDRESGNRALGTIYTKLKYLKLAVGSKINAVNSQDDYSRQGHIRYSDSFLEMAQGRGLAAGGIANGARNLDQQDRAWNESRR